MAVTTCARDSWFEDSSEAIPRFAVYGELLVITSATYGSSRDWRSGLAFLSMYRAAWRDHLRRGSRGGWRRGDQGRAFIRSGRRHSGHADYDARGIFAMILVSPLPRCGAILSSVLSLKFVYKSERRSQESGQRSCARQRVLSFC